MGSVLSVSFRDWRIFGRQLSLQCSFLQNKLNSCIAKLPCKLNQGSTRENDWEFRTALLSQTKVLIEART